jgi:hypothetical protein
MKLGMMRKYAELNDDCDEVYCVPNSDAFKLQYPRHESKFHHLSFENTNRLRVCRSMTSPEPISEIFDDTPAIASPNDFEIGVSEHAFLQRPMCTYISDYKFEEDLYDEDEDDE